MTVRNCLQVLLPVLFVGGMPVACDPNSLDVTEPEISPVTCTFEFEPGQKRPSHRFEIRGSHEKPEYIVAFDRFIGEACLERHEPRWKRTFDMKVSGWRDSIRFISLVPDGYGKISLLFLPGKKWVNHYDAQGRFLDHAAVGSFCIETEETDDGVNVKVTLPPSAQTMRSLSVRYYATCW